MSGARHCGWKSIPTRQLGSLCHICITWNDSKQRELIRYSLLAGILIDAFFLGSRDVGSIWHSALRSQPGSWMFSRYGTVASWHVRESRPRNFHANEWEQTIDIYTRLYFASFARYLNSNDIWKCCILAALEINIDTAACPANEFHKRSFLNADGHIVWIAHCSHFGWRAWHIVCPKPTSSWLIESQCSSGSHASSSYVKTPISSHASLQLNCTNLARFFRILSFWILLVPRGNPAEPITYSMNMCVDTYPYRSTPLLLSWFWLCYKMWK